MPKRKRKRRRVDPPAVAGSTDNSLLTIAQAVALIASRDRRKGETDDSARDRARKRLMYAIAVSYKVPGSPQRVEALRLVDVARRLLRVGDLARYLNVAFPGKFADVPTGDVTVALHGVAARAIAGSIAQASSVEYPDTVPDCHAQIRRWTDQLIACQAELRGAKAIIAELTPDAKRYRENVATNRKNAGGGNRTSD